MKKLYILLAAVMISLSTVSAQQTNEKELAVDNLSIIYREGDIIPEGQREENSLNIFFDLKESQKADRIKVIIKSVSNGEILFVETLKVEEVDGRVFYYHRNRRKEIRGSGTVMLLMYIDNLTQSDIKVEVFAVDKNGNSSNKLIQ